MVLKQSDDPKFPLYGELPSPTVAGAHGGPALMGGAAGGHFSGPVAGPYGLPPMGVPQVVGGPGIWGGPMPQVTFNGPQGEPRSM